MIDMLKLLYQYLQETRTTENTYVCMTTYSMTLQYDFTVCMKVLLEKNCYFCGYRAVSNDVTSAVFN